MTKAGWYVTQGGGNVLRGYQDITDQWDGQNQGVGGMDSEAAAGLAAEDPKSVSIAHAANSNSAGPPNDPYLKYVKPGLDRVFGVILLIVTSPLLAIAAIGIRVRLGRPVIFRQARIGRNGQPFELYKLRTMVSDRRRQLSTFEGDDRRVTHKSPNDPRVLPFGRTLRSLRLDELPQFWNVVVGDMSLVGPRPELPNIVAEYEEWQHRRHFIRPGITGLWQISDQNGKQMHECVDIDLKYLENMGIRQDLSILLQTPKAMVGSKSGY